MNNNNKKYLELVKKSLMGGLDTSLPENWKFTIHSSKEFKRFMTNGEVRTLIGPTRLDNIEACIQHITEHNVAGDILEAGCWRGGALLYLKACLDFYHPKAQRRLWGTDLFPDSNSLVTSYSKLFWLKTKLKIRTILPKPYKQRLANQIMEAFPNENYEKTTLDKIFALADSLTYVDKKSLISTSSHDLLEAFKRYDLLDDSIQLVPGWFRDTFPQMDKDIQELALLRVDADFYQSTLDTLNHFYPKLKHQGICIIDDYGGFADCKKAVDEYRQGHQIKESMHSVDGICYYWEKVSE